MGLCILIYNKLFCLLCVSRSAEINCYLIPMNTDMCSPDLSPEVSGRQSQSSWPDRQTQVSPRRMQSLSCPASSLTPACARPLLAPGLSPTSVVRIWTRPLMNSSSHPSELRVEDS